MSLLAPFRPTPPGRRRPGRAGRSAVVILLVALTVGAVAAVVVTLASVSKHTVPDTPAPPFSTRAVVVASASCTDPRGRDLVELRGADGRPVTLPLDACGTPSATIVPVTVRAGEPLAQLAGSGRPSETASPSSPMAGRLAVTLGAVAALGVAGLLVALGRERWGRSSRRPARAPSGR